jgi:hypothetical protein
MKRNPIAKALRSPHLRGRSVPDKRAKAVPPVVDDQLEMFPEYVNTHDKKDM